MEFKYLAKQADHNGFIQFSDEENETWAILIDRQDKVVAEFACQEYLDGLTILNMPRDRVPQCADINKVLQARTGWSVVPVDAVIPQSKFFKMLANKEFPAASFIRRRQDLDYLPEPDIFHEFYGHCPLLTNQCYADFVEWYGKSALEADKKGQKILTRLFWFTIEFGLIQHNNKIKVYGGGILSSKEETIYAATSSIPKRVPLDELHALRTPYRYDEIQKLYYTIDSMHDLYRIQKMNLLELLETAHIHGDIEPAFVLC
ncbi:MAG: phenylalanine 4-monooxygenase [Gammaproteobacteria bacterium]|nr:phenylalanine 4-monooxygenase [Gammaproteobacteria bacterium]